MMPPKRIFRGSMVALVTPMHDNGQIDDVAFCRLIDWHIAAGTAGIVVLGTTGEAPTIDAKERKMLIRLAVAQAAGRCLIIVGTGSNCTKTSMVWSQQAMTLGADACLVVTPYYNKPTQAGLLSHFTHICDYVRGPIILYNVPSRTGISLSVETISTLAQHPNCVGLKEAGDDLTRVVDIVAQTQAHNFAVLSGEDALTYDFIKLGAQGVISVTANVVPAKMAAFCNAALAKNHTLAASLQAELLPLHQGLFTESNPIPVKWLLQQQGRIPGGIRLPLTALSEEGHRACALLLDSIMETF